ncbi:MAG: transposase, partial [archaeon]
YNLAISKGTIANTIEQLAGFLGEDYEKLRQALFQERDLFADETSHPIHGRNAWLWTFIGKTTAYLQVELSRGQKVVQKTLHGYVGILHSDFWSAYNKLKCDKQKCLAHLTRELKHLRKKKMSPELKTYCTKLLNLLRYAVKENKQTPRFRTFCEQRLHAIIDAEYSNKDCQRLNKRLHRHATEIFLFTELETETTNNHAERSLRPMVIKRKNTNGSHSLEG